MKNLHPRTKLSAHLATLFTRPGMGATSAACGPLWQSVPGILADPHLGAVCSDCYAVLTATRATLEKIGPLVGIGACSSEVNH